MGQFSETAVDLSSIGIDPAFNNTAANSCNPPFTRIIIKTISSASFASALVDFAGPYQFLDAPVVPATILTPSTLTCSTLSVNLTPASIQSSAYHSWSTSDGNIVGNPGNSIITVNKPGKYYLTTSATAGCPQNKDSVVVGLDNFKPFASAASSGLINPTFTNTSQLLGGDANLSNYSTPYGLSQGLLWNWSNSNGFSSTAQNPLTSDTGWHQLIVTERRNGCKDTAKTYVLPDDVAVLATKFGSLTASTMERKKINVQWTVDESGDEISELERSEDGVNFKQIFRVSSRSTGSKNTYHFTDNLNSLSAPVIYYRVKVLLSPGKHIYSSIVKIANKEIGKSSYVTGIFQKSSGTIQVNYFARNNMPVELKMIDMSGKILSKVHHQSISANSTNMFTADVPVIRNKMIVVQVAIGNEIHTHKMILL